MAKNSSPAVIDVVLNNAPSRPRCSYSERFCQRPVASDTDHQCWAHSHSQETHSIQPQNVVKKVQSDAELLQDLSSKYCPSAKIENSASISADKPEDETTERTNFNYFDKLGSINVDDPAAPFCQIEDSISDDGSDEFDYNYPLGKAGIYTAEELVLMTSDRMEQLKKLYMEELKQISVQMRLSRRKYMAEIAKDRRRRIGDPLTDYVATTPEQKQSMKILGTMRRLHRPYPSPDNILRWSLRSKSSGENTSETGPQMKFTARDQPSTLVKNCSFSSCGETVLPLTKYCTKHILLDRRQLLFSKCPGINIEASGEPKSSPTVTSSPSPSSSSVQTRHISCDRLTLQSSKGLTSPNAGTRLSSSTSSPMSPENQSPANYCSVHRILSSVI